MSLFTRFDWNEFALQVTLTLVHFIWQAFLVAIVFAVIERLFQHLQNLTGNKRFATSAGNASAHYLLACFAFFALPTIAIGTFIVIHESRGPIFLAERVPETAPTISAENRLLPSVAQPIALPTPQSNSPPTTPAHGSFSIGDNKPSNVVRDWTWMDRAESTAPYLSLLYLFGVCLMLCRYSIGIIGCWRLRRTVQPLLDKELCDRFAEQCRRLGLRTKPAISLCQNIAVPVVIGIIKPMILFPTSLVCSLDMNQLVAILTHELAHIRRWDPLVNFVQRLVEAVLFFHPATWWLSRRIRVERENCCDDIASQFVGRVSYADALLQMAETCLKRDHRRMTVLASLSAKGSNSSEFGKRLRRLIDSQGEAQIGFPRGTLITGVTVGFIMFVSLVAWGQNSTIQDESEAEPDRLARLFSPSPVWNKRLEREPSISSLSSPSVIVTEDQVISFSHAWAIVDGRDLERRTLTSSGPDKADRDPDPCFQLQSSDRNFVLHVSQRPNLENRTDGPKENTQGTFDLRVQRISNGKYSGTAVTLSGRFAPSVYPVAIEDGGHFFAICFENQVRIYRTETGEIESILPIQVSKVRAIGFCPNQESFVVADESKLHFWPWRDQGPVQSISTEQPISCLTFTADGQYLAEGPSNGKRIDLRDMRTLKVVRELRASEDAPLSVNGMNISPDGRFLVAQNEAVQVSAQDPKLNRLEVWNLRSGKSVLNIKTLKRPLYCSFSADGKFVIGEFSEADRLIRVAAWNLPEQLLKPDAEPTSDAIDRLGDGIQWSRWGARNGFLSGARLLLPKGGLKAGEPLVVEYRLANVSTETRTLVCYLNTVPEVFVLEQGNRITSNHFGGAEKATTITLAPGEVFIDHANTISIDTTGLAPGKYKVGLGSAFYYPDEKDPSLKHEIPHRGVIPFTIFGEHKARESIPNDEKIRWGEPVAGLSLGVAFEKTQLHDGDLAQADLFVGNFFDRKIECSISLPHPSDGWLFNVQDVNERTILVDRVLTRIFSPPRFTHLELAPGEVIQLTRTELSISRSKLRFSDSETEPSSTYESTLPAAEFRIETVNEEDGDTFRETDSARTLRVKLGEITDYSAIFEIQLRHPDIPGLKINLKSGTANFTVLKDKQVNNVNLNNQLEKLASTNQDVAPPLSQSITGKVAGDLSGVKVTAKFEIEEANMEASSNPTFRVVDERVALTDKNGNFSFPIPEVRDGKEKLRLRLRFEANGYLTRLESRRSVADLSREPLSVSLREARRFKGKVCLPDGSAAVGAMVVTDSKYRPYSWKFPENAWEYPASTFTKTDRDGNFEIDTDPNGATLAIHKAGQAPIMIDDLFPNPISETPEGNQPTTFQFSVASQLKGTVETHDGNRIGGAIIVINRNRKWDEFNMPLSFSTSVAANEKGEFELPPLPSDLYKLTVVARLRDAKQAAEYNRIISAQFPVPMRAIYMERWGDLPIQEPLPAVEPLEVVVPEHELDLVASKEQLSKWVHPPLKLVAVETVTLDLRITVPNDNSTSQSFDAIVSGKHLGKAWSGTGRPRKGERLQLIAPKGLEESYIQTGHALHRLDESAPFELGNTIPLGKVEQSVDGIEIVRPKLSTKRVGLKLPAELLEQVNLGKESLDFQAHYLREGYASETAAKSRVSLPGIRAISPTEFTALALPNEEFEIEIRQGRSSESKVLYRGKHVLRDGENSEQVIDLTTSGGM